MILANTGINVCDANVYCAYRQCQSPRCYFEAPLDPKSNNSVTFTLPNCHSGIYKVYVDMPMRICGNNTEHWGELNFYCNDTLLFSSRYENRHSSDVWDFYCWQAGNEIMVSTNGASSIELKVCNTLGSNSSQVVADKCAVVYAFEL